MSIEDILAEIRSMRRRLKVLEAELRKPAKTLTFADLHGILAGHGETTTEEIDAAKFKCPDDLLELLE